MGGKHFIVKGSLLAVPALVAFLLFSFSPSAHSYDGSQEIVLIAPSEDGTVIARRPAVKVRITPSVKREEIFVLMDNVDITGIVEMTGEGFEVVPVQVLPGGRHYLTVVRFLPDGSQVQREFSFYSRHSEAFEEAYSDNNLSASYESIVKKPGDVDEPYSRFTSNLRSESRIKNGSWELSLQTNLRYFDQSLPMQDPQKKGFDIMDYLFEGRYQKDDAEMTVQAGDVDLNETYNTVNLSRRGITASLGYKDFRAGGFIVDGKEVYGFRNARDGTGIEGTQDENIMGATVEAGLLENRLNMKAIYVTGGEQEDSFGTFEDSAGKKGDVAGFVLNTDFFDGKLTTEAEADFSRYDADISDRFGRESDYAYFIKTGGVSGIFAYDARYEYFGPEYQSIGTPGLSNDIEGYDLNIGAGFDVHSINLGYSRKNDNVEKNRLYSRVYTTEYRADYSYSGLERVPVSAAYSKTISDSTDEPSGENPYRLDTDMISGMIGYQADSWNVNFSTDYSVQNDRTSSANDTSTSTFSIDGSRTFNHVSLSPSLSYNTSKFESDSRRVDTYTGALQIDGEVPHTPLTYHLASTYNRSINEDGSGKSDSVDGDAQISYALGKHFLSFINPVVDFDVTYRKSNIRESGDKNDELILFLVFSTSMPFTI